MIGLFADRVLIRNYHFYFGLIGWSMIFVLLPCAIAIISQWKRNEKAINYQKALVVLLCVNIIYNIAFYPIMIYMSVSKYTLSDAFDIFNLLSTLLNVCLLSALNIILFLFVRNLHKNDPQHD